MLVAGYLLVGHSRLERSYLFLCWLSTNSLARLCAFCLCSFSLFTHTHARLHHTHTHARTRTLHINHQSINQSGWFNTLAGAMKRQFATYVKTQLNSTATAQTLVNGNEQEPAQALAPPPAPPAYRNIGNNGTATTTNSSSSHNHNHNTTAKTYYYRTLSAASSSSSSHSHNTSQSTSPTTEPLTGSAAVVHSIGGATATSGFLRRYASSGIVAGNHSSGSNSTPPSPHLLAGLDRRHRSPDPPPRYNRGQSPLLLRKNLLELSGQPAGSPLLQRR